MEKTVNASVNTVANVKGAGKKQYAASNADGMDQFAPAPATYPVA